MTDSPTLCIFGEVLFDEFPDGSRVLGGAPFNVAWHLQAFGQSPLLVSRVGSDPQGEQVRAAMDEWGMNSRCLQVDGERPTGRVSVVFRDGEPVYDIVADCAYDYIEAVSLPPGTMLYHGSLAARSPVSAAALRTLRAGGPDKVFIDVNLRPPWWRPGEVREWLVGADWVKLNVEELAQLAGAPASTTCGRDFLRRFGLSGLLVTHGSQGAELLLGSGGEPLHVAPEEGIQAVDTVGAGDAFASVMLLGIIRGWPMGLTLERAQRFAAAIVGRRGATVSDRGFYRPFIEQWQLDD